MFRNVAILEGVLARGRAGNAASSSAEEKEQKKAKSAMK